MGNNLGTMAALANKLGKGLFGLAAAGFVFDNCVYSVDPGTAAVLKNEFSVPGICEKGVDTSPVQPGLHLKFPYIQQVNIFDLRTAPFELPESTSRTNDQQQVRIKLRLLSRPREEALPQIFSKYGGDNQYKTLVLTGVMKQVLPTVVARYNAEDLIVQRDRVSQEVRTHLTQRCLDFGVELEDVAIVDCVFSREWQMSVAQQMAEREKFVVLASEQQRKIAEIKASADSASADLMASAFSKHGDSLVKLRQLEAAREIAKVMSQSPNVTYLPGSNGKGDKGNMMLNVGA